MPLHTVKGEHLSVSEENFSSSFIKFYWIKITLIILVLNFSANLEYTNTVLKCMYVYLQPNLI
jgi:hypothetical protein